MTDKTQKEKLESYNPELCPFSWDKLDGLLAYKSSLVVCADILDVSESTIKNHIKQRYGMSFSEYAEKKLSRTKVKLVQKAIEMATSGNVAMMIFCLKNICKWSDNNNEVTDISEIKINIEKDDFEL
jgi:predicted transcriptional regulator